MWHTGGLAWATISTKSRPSSWAMARAWSGDMIPSCSPSRTTRIRGTLMWKLTRGPNVLSSLLGCSPRKFLNGGKESLLFREVA